MAVDVDGICFGYSGRGVLSDVGFQASEGEVTAIVGPNGSGKSTLLKCIARILSPSKGKVLLDGTDISTLPGRDLAQIMGYVPQNAAEVFPITVFESVLLGRRPHITWRVDTADKETAIKAMEHMGITDLASRRTDELSGGERQKVLFAWALAQEPQVFLLDEPTSSLDIRYQLETMEMVRSLANGSKRTVIVVLHDLNMAARYSDKLILLAAGRIYASGSPTEVLTAGNIGDVYGVEVEIREGRFGPSILPIGPI